MINKTKVLKGLGEATALIEREVPERYIGYSKQACIDACELLKKEWVCPFENDPFVMVYQAFKNLYPDKDCEIMWQPVEMKDEEGKGYVGLTTFADDGTITVEISVYMKIGDAVETLAHELAHVAVGASEDHGEEWEKAFDAIHEEFNRIGNELFGEDTGVAIEVSDGKGGVDPSRLE